jgi:hypothetical protein
MGEALSYEFEGMVLNPFGVDIDLPFWVFKRLKKPHLLERDRPIGKMRMRARVFGFTEAFHAAPKLCGRALSSHVLNLHGQSHGQSRWFWENAVAVSY